MLIQNFTIDNLDVETSQLEKIVSGLNENQYFCPIDSQQNFLEIYIYQLAYFHSNKRNIELNNKYTIQYELIRQNNLQIEYIKQQKKYPIFTILCYFSEKNSPLIFTEIGIDEYKYKDFKSKNKIGIYCPTQGTHTIFDSSKYYGMLNSSASNTYLKINVWDIEISGLKLYSPNYLTDISFSRQNMKCINEIKNDNIFETSEYIYDNTIFEKIIYQTNEIDVINNINKIIINKTDYKLIIIHYIKKEGIDYLKLVSECGECIKDIVSIIDNNLKIDEENIFNRNKIIKNLIPVDICYWILNECYKQINWNVSIHKNYEYQLNLEKFPHILNYILFISNFWLSEIRKLYSMPRKLNLNIKEIFIAKYATNKIVTEKNVDNNFLIMNVQLNDAEDYTDGEIIFNTICNNEETVKLNKSDCIIYNGKKQRTPGNVSNGEKFVLVIMIEIL
jgi:hypothetical protein